MGRRPNWKKQRALNLLGARRKRHAGNGVEDDTQQEPGEEADTRQTLGGGIDKRNLVSPRKKPRTGSLTSDLVNSESENAAVKENQTSTRSETTQKGIPSASLKPAAKSVFINPTVPVQPTHVRDLSTIPIPVRTLFGSFPSGVSLPAISDNPTTESVFSIHGHPSPPLEGRSSYVDNRPASPASVTDSGSAAKPTHSPGYTSMTPEL